MRINPPLVYDSLDRINAPTQQVRTKEDRSWIVVITAILLGSMVMLILFFTGKHEVAELVQTSFGTSRTFMEWLYTAITLFQVVLPVIVVLILGNMAYSWIRRNNIISGLELPLHVRTLESEQFATALVDGAVKATLARMQQSQYQGVSTLTLDTSTSTNTSTNSTSAAQVKDKEADKDELNDKLYFDLSILDAVNK